MAGKLKLKYKNDWSKIQIHWVLLILTDRKCNSKILGLSYWSLFCLLRLFFIWFFENCWINYYFLSVYLGQYLIIAPNGFLTIFTSFMIKYNGTSRQPRTYVTKKWNIIHIFFPTKYQMSYFLTEDIYGFTNTYFYLLFGRFDKIR